MGWYHPFHSIPFHSTQFHSTHSIPLKTVYGPHHSFHSTQNRVRDTPLIPFHSKPCTLCLLCLYHTVILRFTSHITMKCMICLDPVNNDAAAGPCGHLFCRTCLTRWISTCTGGRNCPSCRVLVNEANAHRIYGAGEQEINNNSPEQPVKQLTEEATRRNSRNNPPVCFFDSKTKFSILQNAFHICLTRRLPPLLIQPPFLQGGVPTSGGADGNTTGEQRQPSSSRPDTSHPHVSFLSCHPPPRTHSFNTFIYVPVCCLIILTLVFKYLYSCCISFIQNNCPYIYICPGYMTFFPQYAFSSIVTILFITKANGYSTTRSSPIV
jgi:hypothetical protein